MSSTLRRALGLILLAGCASRPPPEPERPGQYDYSKMSAEFDERIADDLRWQPGARTRAVRS